MLTYNQLENEFNIASKDGIVNFKAKQQPSIIEHLLFNGYRIEAGYSTSVDILPKKPYLEALYVDMEQLIPLRKKLLNGAKLTHEDRAGNQEIFDSLCNLKILDENYCVPDNMCKYFGGTTFEEYVFCIAYELGFDDMLCGVKVYYDDNDHEFNSPSNEFDVVMLKNNRLFIIECKMTDSYDPRNIIYSLEATKNRLHSLSKAIFLAIHEEPNAKFQKGLRKRAKSWGIELLVCEYISKEDMVERLTSYLKSN